MPEVDVEADPFLKLLTDALRAGPGSPEWHQAVAQLRDSPEAARHRDEYQLLVAARERLEQGKEYRSVRAGPGFTRKLMAGIEREEENPGGAGPSIPTAGLVALGSTLAILAVLAFVAFFLFRGPDVEPGDGVEALAKLNFLDPVASATFDGKISDGWKTIGKLPLDAANGLRPADPPVAVGNETLGGGVYRIEPLPADKPFMVEARVTVPADRRPAAQPSANSGGTIMQVFVSDSPDFSEDRATAPAELVWSLQNGQHRVIVAGQFQGRAEPVGAAGASNITIRLNRTHAVIEHAGRRLWAGEHRLAPDGRRYVGVRFLRAGGAAPADLPTPSVDSISILTTSGDAATEDRGSARPAEGR